MIVRAGRDGFTVVDGDDFTRFHVDAPGLSASELQSLVARTDGVRAHEEADHLWIGVGFLREHLDTASRPDRQAGLDGMLGYAGKKGWLDEAGSHVAAHVQGD